MNNETLNIWTHFLPTWYEQPFTLSLIFYSVSFSNTRPFIYLILR